MRNRGWRFAAAVAAAVVGVVLTEAMWLLWCLRRPTARSTTDALVAYGLLNGFVLFFGGVLAAVATYDD
jgi:hypothetical protein